MTFAALMMAVFSAKAQDVTITLSPGWTWISYTQTEMKSIADVLGDLVPVEGDRILSQYQYTSFTNGRWRGNLTQFIPGMGYMYYSSRGWPVTLVMGGVDAPALSTSYTTNVTAMSAVAGGMVTVPSGGHVFLRGVCWGTATNPDIDGDHTDEGSGIGNFSGALEGLDPNTTYYVRAYAVTDHGLFYGNELNFTTMNGIPEVSTAEVTDITANSAVCGGTVTVDGGLAIIAQGVCWSTNHNPTMTDSHTTDGAGTGSFTSNLTGLTPNTTYYVRAYATNSYVTVYGGEKTFTTENGGGGDDHAYVDLGLPSGLLWATCNIGANTPEDYGDYFAWGETQPKGTYNWTTYQYCNGSNNTFTKYCSNSSCGYNGFTDNLTTLLPEDDAVTANWGGGWRMPTKEEWGELINNTTVTWTMQNGVSGRLFTASNGNSLFLPAAGYRYNNSLYSDGGDGDYWSSTLDTDGPSRAWSFDFYSDYYGMGYSGRYYGRSVRAVRSGQNVQSYTINVSAIPSDGGNVSGGGTYEQGQSCTVTATANSGYVFINWTENGEVVSTDAAYSFALTGNRNLLANFTASSGDDHAYVDLGLPSGTLWATCNVGANAPEEYGDYFAWGETQPKDYYGWETYQYCNGSYNTLTKYCNNSNYGNNGFTDNLTALLPEDDDAATANWGSEWRMPTKEEWEELYNNTTCIWTIQNGVNGLLFTVSNGDCLFLPAAGCRYSSNLYYAGSRGYYWSSTLYTGGPDSAWNYYFYSDYYYLNLSGRYYGQSVRAVRSGQN